VAGGGSFADQLVEVVGLGGGEFAHGEVVEDEDGGAGVFAEAAVPAAVGVAAGQVGQGAAGLGEADVGAGPDGEVAEGLGDVAFADAGSDGDRLQHLRAVLPCGVRVTAAGHPLFGELLGASAFRRFSGVLHLVVELPDGSPGTIRADATDVLAAGEPGPAATVLDAAGVRALRVVVTAMADAASPRQRRRSSK
jgi:hypothetical protein